MQSVIAVFAGLLLLSGLGKYSGVAALSPTADIWEDVLYLAEQGIDSAGPCSALIAVAGTEQLGAAAPQQMPYCSPTCCDLTQKPWHQLDAQTFKHRPWPGLQQVS